jgi:hypothetical protein
MAFSHHTPHLPMHHPILKILAILMLLFLCLLVASMLQRPRQLDRTLLATPALSTMQAHAQVIPHAPGAAVQPLKGTIRLTSLETVLQALLKGPTPAQKRAGLYSEIPAGTRLLGVTVDGNRVTVNLTREFDSGAGATSAIQRVEELKNAVRSVNPNYRVKIAIEGKPVRILTSDGLELEEWL